MNNLLFPVFGAMAGGVLGPDSTYISLGAVAGAPSTNTLSIDRVKIVYK
jgi:hypothetical protein